MCGVHPEQRGLRFEMGARLWIKRRRYPAHPGFFFGACRRRGVVRITFEDLRDFPFYFTRFPFPSKFNGISSFHFKFSLIFLMTEEARVRSTNHFSKACYRVALLVFFALRTSGTS